VDRLLCVVRTTVDTSIIRNESKFNNLIDIQIAWSVVK